MRLTYQTCVIVFALSFTPVLGQEAAPMTARDKVAKIVNLQQVTQQSFVATVENSVPQFINALRLRNPAITANQIRQAAEIYKQALVDSRSFMNDAAIDAWTETLSEEEIDAVYKFYSSPVGAAIAAKQSSLLQSIQSKNRMVAQTIFGPELAKRLKSDPMLKDLAF